VEDEVSREVTKKQRNLFEEVSHKVVEEEERVSKEAQKATELKNKNEEEERSVTSTPGSTKEVSLLTSPLDLGIVLNVISFYFFYLDLNMLEFDDELVVVGKLYHRNLKQGITRRPSIQ